MHVKNQRSRGDPPRPVHFVRRIYPETKTAGQTPEKSRPASPFPKPGQQNGFRAPDSSGRCGNGCKTARLETVPVFGESPETPSF
jgi:hypothetical protein